MNVMEQITAILAESFGLSSDEIHADSRLEADLGINSLELAELALRCDEEFGVEIEDEETPLAAGITPDGIKRAWWWWIVAIFSALTGKLMHDANKKKEETAKEGNAAEDNQQ